MPAVYRNHLENRKTGLTAEEIHPLCLRHLPQRGRWPEGLNNVMQWRRFYDLKGAHDAETTFEPDDEGTSVFLASADDEGGVSSLVSFPTQVSGEVPAATGDGGFYL